MATTLRNNICDAAADIREKVASGDKRTLMVSVLALVCVVAPFDISQLLLVLVGIGAAALLQPMAVAAPRPRKCPPTAQAGSRKYTPPAMRAGGAPAATGRRLTASPVDAAAPAMPKPASRPIARLPTQPLVAQPSAVPIAEATFQATGFDAQADELVKSLLPTASSEEAVNRLVMRIRRSVQSIVPEADVRGFASGSALRGRAFGVAVPDVDVVVNCSLSVLSSRLHPGRSIRQQLEKADRRQLHKASLRWFTDRLVASGHFKFRRSAFSADEPKVTLLAGESASTADAVPLDFFVNAALPRQNAMLLEESARFDARARALILLVRRWARDRGICHASKGHLSPYCWTLLAIYFLQVGIEDGEQVLPAMGHLQPGAAAIAPARRAGSTTQKSVGSLFRDFFAFFDSRFDARSEAICVRLGRRAAPNARLPLHVVTADGVEGSEVALCIEDPFDESRNLAAGMNSMGLARMREEIARAASLLSGKSDDEASMSELLKLWVPEDAAAGGKNADEQE